jgi:nucleoside-diphosphate-sugar epimerase
VIGASGLLGRNLCRTLSKDGIEVLPVTSVNGSKVGRTTTYSAADVVSGRVFQNGRIDTAILAVRGKNAAHPRFGTLPMLRSFENSVKQIINFSTYAQHYEIRHHAKIYDYVQFKRSVSDYLAYSSGIESFYDISLFTLIGLEDSPTSLMSQLIDASLSGKTLELSEGNQLVSYTSVNDVCNLVRQVLLREYSPPTGSFSYWPEPPEKLRDIVNLVRSLAPRNFAVEFGKKPYGGHEIFHYDKTVFPKQIRPDCSWEKIEDAIKFLLQKTRNRDNEGSQNEL